MTPNRPPPPPTLARLPPLTAVRAFVVAARQGSFVRAASELNVTPAAVGQQVRLLEDYLGCRLFTRDGKGLLPTHEAETLLPPLTEGFNQLLAGFDALHQSRHGRRLVVSVAPSFAAKWLLPRLDSFQERHPDIDLRVSASMALVDFDRDGVDCALRFGAGHYPGLVVEKLLPEDIFPVCAPFLITGGDGRPPLRSPDDLAHYPLLHDDGPDRDASCPDWRMWLKAAGVQTVPTRLGLHFDQSALVLDAAIRGQGVALAKARLAERDLTDGRLIRPFGDARRLDFAYYLVTPPTRLPNPALTPFRMWLLEQAMQTSE